MVGLEHLTVALASLLPQVFAACATINPAQAPTFGSGFSGRVVINGLRTPRGIVFDKLGNMLIAESGGYGIRYVQLTDNGGTDVCVASQKQLISDSALNHGIALSPDGNTLFVSSLASAWSYSYDAATGTVSNKKTLINGMRTGGGHLSRTLVAPASAPGLLLVQRGSEGNIDTPTSTITSGRSQIRIFNISQIQQSAVDYTAGEVLGWGLRNSVGVSEHPITGGIFSVENGVDDMKRNNMDIHADNPCEELNYHGVLNATSSLRGANYGYPTCFAAWDPSIVPDNANIQVGTQFFMGTSSAAQDQTCAQKTPPTLCFPAHTAPLDVKVKPDGTAMYISFHGSWNRPSPDGFRLSRVAMDPATGMPKDPSTSKSHEQQVMYNANNGGCPNRCFRPVGLAFDSKSRLFMASDSTNEVWIIGGA